MLAAIVNELLRRAARPDLRLLTAKFRDLHWSCGQIHGGEGGGRGWRLKH